MVVTFDAQWANIAWDMMRLDPASELKKVCDLSKHVLDELGASTFNASLAAADEHTPRMQFSSIRLGARRAGLAVSSIFR